MGEGEILDLNTDKGAYLIEFEGVDTPREISFKVKLEKVKGMIKYDG
jgi:DNA helicase-2/ATP-dependent DNA helicase PcrA